MLKVSVFGAGNVGAEVARRIVEKKLADVVLVDIVEGIPQGKALDILQSGPVEGFDCNIKGTNNPADIEGSEIVVVTAGLARKPGMSRDDLQAANARIVKGITENIKKYAPGSIIIMVTNPLDVMTYLAWKISGFEKRKVFGMAGELDTARMITFISMGTGIPSSKIKAMVLGGHGDLMVPLISQTKVDGKPLDSCLSKEKIDLIIKRTANGGAEIVDLLKTGSAYYAPSASAVKMVEAVIKNKGSVIPSAVILDGEYGLKDACIGVPAKIGRNGIEAVIELKLTDEEMSMLARSASAVKESIAKLGTCD
ncbi:MAG: malate dehydrogenase [bacterium]